MQVMGRKRIWNSPFFTYFRKHICPKCGEILKVIQVSRIVNSNSEEAKDYDFFNVDNYMLGNIEFIWDEFKCSRCNYQVSIKDMKKRKNNS